MANFVNINISCPVYRRSVLKEYYNEACENYKEPVKSDTRNEDGHQKILNENGSTTRVKTIVFNNYYNNFNKDWFGGYAYSLNAFSSNNHTVNIINQPKTEEEIKNEEKEKKQKNNTIVMALAATAALVACAILGYASAKLKVLTENYRNADEILTAASQPNVINDASNNDKIFFNTVKNFRNITLIKYNIAKNLEKSALGGLVSSVSLFAGAYFAVPILTTVGTFSMIGSLGYGIYHAFHYYVDSKKIETLSKQIINDVSNYFATDVPNTAL